MNQITLDPKQIFLGAIEQTIPESQARYLDEACQGDSTLRARVEQLLQAHHHAGRFLGGASGDASLEQAISEKPGTVIGPYKLLQQIGDGGFGIVFMAEQTDPAFRRVALKVIKPGMDTRQIIARFEAERQALSMMDHVNIARVLDAGATDAGRPYFVMELVNGVPITDYCDGNSLPVRERLELFASLCRAIQHAHSKGIIHRDIKPSNVLVAWQDGQPVVKVIDFGIAKALGQQLTERTLFTGFTQMIGTPLYMSPEQAEVSSPDIDTRSDIYSLGVLLYELLTGTTPFDKEQFKTAGYDEIRRIVRHEDPVKPSTRISMRVQDASTVAANRNSDQRGLRRQFQGELDWIVMKCLDKDRNRRYETPASLAADVHRFLADEPVLACPPSAVYRFRKLARRHKGAIISLSTAAFAAALAVSALAVSTTLVWRANENLTESLDRERQEANFHRITLAHRELSVNNLRRARELLGECPEDLREWEWHYLMRLCRVEPLIVRDTTGVNSLSFSADGERLASAGSDGAVKILNSRTGELIQTLSAHDGAASSVVFHPDGKHVASVGLDGHEKNVKVWELTSGRQVFAGQCDGVHAFGTAYAAAFSPFDGRQLAAGSGGEVTVWDWRNNRILHTFVRHERHRSSLAFSRDGRRLASGNWGGNVQIWNTETGGEPLLNLPGTTPHPVAALAFNRVGDRLATANFGRRVEVWDTATGRLLQTLAHSAAVLGVAFSPDGRRLASAGEDKTLRLWDTKTGREVLGLRGHAGLCGCIAFSPDGRRLASASVDGTIRVWDATPLQGHEGQEILTYTHHRDEVWSVAVSPDGRKIASAGWAMPAQVWHSQTGQGSVAFSGHQEIVFCVVWQPDGQRVASAGGRGDLFSVKLWDPQTGREDILLPALPGEPEFFAVAFSPDGRHLVTGKANGSVDVWEARTGQLLATLGTHERMVRGVVFSQDGRQLASVSGDGKVKLWDADRLTEKQDARRTLQAWSPGQSLNVAFSPDGVRLVTGGTEHTARIWDVATGRQIHTLRGHTGDVYTVAFSPANGGRWVASAGEDSTVKIWNSHTGVMTRSLRGHTGLVSSITFSPDGRRLVSGSRDHTVRVWDVADLETMVDR